MITVRKEFQCKEGTSGDMVALLKEYKETFDPTPSCRIYQNVSGQMSYYIIEDDFESLGDSEVKWAERTSTPEFQAWISKWKNMQMHGTFEWHFLRIIE